MRRLLFGLLALFAWSPAGAITIQDVASPGGLHAWLVEDHTQKVISLSFAIPGGSASDPADKPGLSTFALSLLDEGAGPYDSGQYQGRLADLSASVSFDAAADYLTGGLETLSPTRDEVFELLRLALSSPRFDPPAVERIRGELLQLIDGEQQEPDAIASHAFLKAEFPGHPYGAWPNGTLASAKAMTIDDLKAFARTRLSRAGLLVAVVGDISAEELKPLLDKTFGGLPATSSAAPVPDAVPAAPAELLLARKPVPQSVARFGQPGLPIKDKDFYALMVVNRVLGGSGFTARLEAEVREKRGLAYGITTSLLNRRHADLIEGSVGTQNARLADTVAIVRQEWARMRDEGPTEAELADAKRFLNGNYTIGLDSTGAIAQRLIGLQQEGLPIDYFTRRPQLIDAVTLEDAKRAARRVLDPAKLLFVVVGDPTGVKPDKELDPAE